MSKRLIHTETFTTGMGIVYTAKVYRDSEYSEYVVQFARDKNTNFKASYHTGVLADAKDTAQYHIKRISKQFA